MIEIGSYVDLGDGTGQVIMDTYDDDFMYKVVDIDTGLVIDLATTMAAIRDYYTLKEGV